MSNSVSKMRVLAVDDEFVIASTWAQILRMSGFDADWATSGEEAIMKARQMRPDILLSDVLMHGIDGFQTAAEILKIRPDCRVILISGHAETTHSILLDHPGQPSVEILRKPIHPLVLLEKIRDSMQFIDPGTNPPSRVATRTTADSAPATTVATVRAQPRL
ncbi:MAG: response regulator [Acidobacteria bacterium]|nr:response regulator [Acidobacteriota bacterium]